VGSSTGLRLDFYQPVTRNQRWFVEAAAEYRRDRVDYFFERQRVAEYDSFKRQAELLAGINMELLGQLRLGWRATRVKNQLDTGIDIFSLLPERATAGPLLALDMDRLDRLYFPHSGWAAQASIFDDKRLGFSRVAAELRAALPWQNYVLAGRASWVGGLRGQLPLAEAGRLGGFLNLTGFASGQLIGDDVAYAHIRSERIIGRLPLGLRGDMRFGLALEAGRVGTPYAKQRRDGWLYSGAVYLGGETPLGPVYIGVGRGSGSITNAYLFLGTP
jgi:NTE family protein